jgi:hypothetical protein
MLETFSPFGAAASFGWRFITFVVFFAFDEFFLTGIALTSVQTKLIATISPTIAKRRFYMYLTGPPPALRLTSFETDLIVLASSLPLAALAFLVFFWPSTVFFWTDIALTSG